MRKIIVFFFLIILVGCTKINVITDDDIILFDKYVEEVNNSKAIGYDLREMENYEAGHIKGFVCARTKTNGEANTLDDVVNNITELYNKSKKIILICEVGSASEYVYVKLVNSGYNNIYYFKSGYSGYLHIKGDSFAPEIGCNC